MAPFEDALVHTASVSWERFRGRAVLSCLLSFHEVDLGMGDGFSLPRLGNLGHVACQVGAEQPFPVSSEQAESITVSAHTGHRRHSCGGGL